jgi:mono/diheme cytochrome c family protein
MKRIRWFFPALALMALLPLLAGCGGKKKDAEMTDAELGLNAQQASGRQIYKMYCASCHYAYSSAGSQGPSMKGLFKRKYLPSGLPANDRFVRQTVVAGRNMMPPAGSVLNPQQLDDLMAYLHTL